MTEEEAEHERKKVKIRVKNIRERKSNEEKEAEKQNKKERMRILRENRVSAKKSLREYHERSFKNKKEILDWKEYCEKGESFAEVLHTRKPDLIERINQEIREEKERDRKKREEERERRQEEEKRRKDGIWEYNGESGEYYWTGEKEPEQTVDTCVYEPLTEEEKKLSEET